MADSAAQVRALDTLAHHRLSDRTTLEALARLYPVAKSVSSSGRSPAFSSARLPADRDARTPARTAGHRLKSPDGQDLIDVLIRRLAVLDPLVGANGRFGGFHCFRE
jgi:hypothetical protein